MPKDITFNEVCEFIKSNDGRLIDATGKLLGAALVCSPIVFGPAALPALGLLGVKNELTSLGKKLLSSITSRRDPDYLARMRRMEIAYGLICYTAFFDTLDSLLPDDLRKEINLQAEDRKSTAKQAREYASDEPATELEGPFNESLPFPHPTSSLEDLATQLERFYQHMAKDFGEFVDKLSVFEKAYKKKKKKKNATFQKLIEKLPEAAMKRFEAQYFELSRKYEDFRIWVQLKDSKRMSDYFKHYDSLFTLSLPH